MAARATSSRARFLAASSARGPAPLALTIYGVLSLVTVGIAVLRDESPIELGSDAWLILPSGLAHGLSLALGALLAFVTVGATRGFVRRWNWAKTLHADLRPAVRDLSDGAIVVLGIASGVAEELFFRGLLLPTLGLTLTSLAFGAVHRLSGRSGWSWATWATIMGVLFGALYVLTGSLLGPMLAHAAINVVNLRFLRDTDVAACNLHGHGAAKHTEKAHRPKRHVE